MSISFKKPEERSIIAAMFSGYDKVAKLTDNIIAKLPKEHKDGMLYHSNSDIYIYFGTVVSGVTFFFACYVVARYLLRRW